MEDGAHIHMVIRHTVTVVIMDRATETTATETMETEITDKATETEITATETTETPETPETAVEIVEMETMAMATAMVVVRISIEKSLYKMLRQNIQPANEN